MPRRIVIIGGGPAGVWAAIEAKKYDPVAEVTLLTAEASEPYEKPPLSKAVLLRRAEPQDSLIAGQAGIEAHGVKLLMDARCTAINRERRQIFTSIGAISYDALIIATGSVVRELECLPMGMEKVHYLRNDVQARRLSTALTGGCQRIVVIGAGLIGMEVAASAAQLGAKVVVIEAASRIMARTCDPEIAELIAGEHRSHGIDFKLGVLVTHATAAANGTVEIQTNKGETVAADQVVVGLGVTPDVELAIRAGLSVEDGILVDKECRTSDPRIFAAGDVTRFPGPNGSVRLENWRHAQDHGGIAGRNAAGASDRYNAMPSFWSEQYELYIQGIGWPDPAARKLRRLLPSKRALLLEMKGSVIAAASGINVPRDISAIRRLIERSILVDDATLADAKQNFSDLLKPKS